MWTTTLKNGKLKTTSLSVVKLRRSPCLEMKTAEEEVSRLSCSLTKMQWTAESIKMELSSRGEKSYAEDL